MTQLAGLGFLHPSTPTPSPPVAILLTGRTGWGRGRGSRPVHRPAPRPRACPGPRAPSLTERSDKTRTKPRFDGRGRPLPWMRMGSARACPGDVGGTWPCEAVTKIDAGVPVFRVSPGCAASVYQCPCSPDAAPFRPHCRLTPAAVDACDELVRQPCTVGREEAMPKRLVALGRGGIAAVSGPAVPPFRSLQG